MRIAAISAFALCTGCVSGSTGVHSVTDAYGASLSLISLSSAEATLELSNLGRTPLAYDHWMSQGPEPVPHCRDTSGRVRICARRIYLTSENEPYVHEAYLQPGASVELRAVPGQDEQVGVHVWRGGKDGYLWLEIGTPNKPSEKTSER